jgi:hypothetical protein
MEGGVLSLGGRVGKRNALLFRYADAAVKVAGAAKTVRLPNGITIHGPKGSPEVSALSRVCKDFPEVWSKSLV